MTLLSRGQCISSEVAQFIKLSLRQAGFPQPITCQPFTNVRHSLCVSESNRIHPCTRRAWDFHLETAKRGMHFCLPHLQPWQIQVCSSTMLFQPCHNLPHHRQRQIIPRRYVFQSGIVCHVQLHRPKVLLCVPNITKPLASKWIHIARTVIRRCITQCRHAAICTVGREDRIANQHFTRRRRRRRRSGPTLRC